ncbi:terminase large subunit domain-containing protein [Escherichia coli]
MRYGLTESPALDLFLHPSTLAHDAYPFWSGELFNRGRASAAERVEIDVSHNALAGGLLCADGQWRQIVTIQDALKGGCTLFDIEQLKRENSADDFKNLFMCEFVDDKASVFPFEELQRCMVDTLEGLGSFCAVCRQSVRLPPGLDWLRPVTPWRQRRMRGTGTAGGGQ